MTRFCTRRETVLDYSLEGDQGPDEQQQRPRPSSCRYRMRPVDVAEILVAPVPVTYTAGEYEDDASGERAGGGKEKMAMFWVVMLRTRKCYSFSQHLQCMINELDKEDKSRLQKAANREYEVRIGLREADFAAPASRLPNCRR